jgi:iron complex outermembrane receptor protein
MIVSVKKKTRNLLVVLVFLAAPLFAFAQEALEEITVTAERREAGLQRTALSVVAFSAERLDELGINDPQSLADFTPNVSIGDGTGRGSGGTSVSIRGVNEARVSPVLDPAVGIYVDDVYYGRPQTAFLKLLDVERVEVLRGPQGTLFGKNSVGGAIRYITVKPQFDSVNGYVKVAAGDYDRAEVKGAINLPLSDTAALRFTAAKMSRDGYVERLSDGVALGDEDTLFGMAQLRFQPNDRLDINFRLDYTERDTDDGPTKLIDYYRFNNTTDTTPGGPTAASPGSAASAAWNGYWGSTPRVYDPAVPASLYQVEGSGRLPVLESESVGAGIDLTWTISDTLSVRSITGYRTVDEFTIRDPDDQADAWTFFDDIAEEGVDFWSQEFQLNGSNFDDRFTWVGGVFYSVEEPYRREIEDRDGRSPLRRGMLILNDDALQETKSLGIYFQGNIAMSDKLDLTLGVRYTEDDKTYRISQVALWDSALAADAAGFGLAPQTPPDYNGCDPSVQASCVSVAPLSGGDTFDSITPRVALQYQFTDDFMAYASASMGFKAGGTNDSVADIDTPFEPEELWTYEVGVRSEFADGRARINATYYTSDYTDKQITVTTSPNCVNRCTTNVGEGSISGFEIDAVALLGDSFQVHAGLGTIDAKWDTIDNPSAGVTLISEFGRAPELSYTLGGRYTFELANSGQIVATADYAYTDDQNSSPQDSTTIFIQDYSLLALRLAYISPDARWETSLFCTNCTDEEYYYGGAAWGASSDNTPFPGVKPANSYIFVENGQNPDGIAPPGITLLNIGAPRMWGVDFRYNFGS